MKKDNDSNKLRGGYYTPFEIAQFISNWAIRNDSDCILEPSCGDGVFIGTAIKALQRFTQKCQITGIELVREEANKAMLSYPQAQIINSDFFTYYKKKISQKKQFNVIVGNPPFIRYQNFDENYRSCAFELMQEYGFSPNRLTNIWLPFLLLSCKALSSDGRLGMVIPAELFQVDYAAEARLFLSSFFDSLYIITFKKLVFEGIQQEIVLLLGERSSSEKGIKVFQLDEINDLKNINLNKSVNSLPLDHSSDKWTKYFLSSAELELMRKLEKNTDISMTTDLFETNVGIVSGENEFFLINKERADIFGLKNLSPIIGRSDQLSGIRFTEDDFNEQVIRNKKVFLLDIDKELPSSALSEEQKKYIAWGEQNNFDKNYKCTIRTPWYAVPKSWKADAYIIRQANLCPRIILNEFGAYNTDTLHKIRFIKGVNGRNVTAAFLNSYTLALSETLGRSYGGGVLTFEPGEIRKMRIPLIGSSNLSLNELDNIYRQQSVEAVLDVTDYVLLKDGLGLDNHDIKMLRNIWKTLSDRRLSRKNDCSVKGKWGC